MDKSKNILAINFGGIGDEIFFLPTLISIKKEFPNSKITLALEQRSKAIRDLTDIIDDLIFVDIKGKNKYFELIKMLLNARLGNFDIVISSGGNKLISILLFLTGIKERYGYNTGKLSQLLLTKAVKLDKNRYACAMYHELATPITKIYTELPIINVYSQEKIANSVLIHPGVSKMSLKKGIVKTVPPKIWAKTIDLLLQKGKKVILAGGPDDSEVIEYILNNIDINNPNFENFYGKTKNIKDLAILIGKAEKFICSDSAPLHIGVALATRTYAIFGPTDDKHLIPDKNFVTPIKTMDNCPLKPCLWARRNTTCEKPDCLNISAENIVNAVCDND